MKLQRFNGDELFNVETATVDYYVEEDGKFATTFRADAATPAIETLSDTIELHAKPFTEIMLSLTKHPGVALLAGRSYSLSHGLDDASGEHLTNFYYYEHELMHNIEITVIKRHLDRAQLRITGTITDVNCYDGSKPPAKVIIDAEFTLTFAGQS